MLNFLDFHEGLEGTVVNQSLPSFLKALVKKRPQIKKIKNSQSQDLETTIVENYKTY